MSKKACVLVINCGSSSLKYEVFLFPEKTSLGKGIVERIGENTSVLTHEATVHQKTFENKTHIKNHEQAFKIVSETICHATYGIIESPKQITAVGHRVVHGGKQYSQSVVIDNSVINIIDELSALAPLHNPPNLDGIKSALMVFPHCKHVAVFDTAFHQTIPQKAFMYALPYTIYTQFDIRKYGFHGTSHQYVSKQAAKLLEKNTEKVNLITCHLGNGSSIAAIRNGQSVDTTMGFTPLAGLMMGTRSGDIDPAIVPFLINKGMTSKEIDTILNKKSGLLGISEISNDMRDLETATSHNNKATLALEMYAYHVRKFIGAYVAELTHVDMVVFTAGIGQHARKMRQRICAPLTGLGIYLDEQKNNTVEKTSSIISQESSPVKIAVIPTNEELQIASDAYYLTQ